MSTTTSPFRLITSDKAKLFIYEEKANLIHAARAQINMKNMTQNEAASAAGVSQPRISSMLKGDISKFSLDSLVSIAIKLGVSVSLNASAEDLA